MPSILFVSPPFKTAIDTFVVVASRTLKSAEGGAFSGVVAATLDPEYFDALMRSVVYAPDMRTTPGPRRRPGFIAIPAGGEQPRDVDLAVLPTIASHSLVVRANRLVATRRIDRDDLHLNKPMFITASRELEALYAPGGLGSSSWLPSAQS